MRLKKVLVALFLVCCMGFTGCAGFGVWSDSAKSKLDKLSQFNHEWLIGAAEAAPKLVTLAQLFPAARPYAALLQPAVDVLSKAVKATDSAISAGDSKSTVEARNQAVIDAMNEVSGIVGNLEALGVKL